MKMTIFAAEYYAYTVVADYYMYTGVMCRGKHSQDQVLLHSVCCSSL